MLLPAIFLTILTGPIDQSIEPDPDCAETAQTVRVEAREADGRPIGGLAIEVRWPDGRVETIGSTDVRGRVGFVPTVAGSYRLAARREGVLLLAPLRVVDAQNRLLHGIVFVPIGVALLWWNLRKRSSRSPSRPAP